MLVLRRKVGESIIVDGVISISVLAVEGERVKIGINAPPGYHHCTRRAVASPYLGWREFEFSGLATLRYIFPWGIDNNRHVRRRKPPDMPIVV